MFTIATWSLVPGRAQADRAEAEMRSEHRRIQIERANKILFDETDRVKALHGKMLQSDAIKENEALIEFKKQIDVLKKAQEATFVEQQRQAMEVRCGGWRHTCAHR